MESTDPDYEKQFTRNTPRPQGSAYLRILDPVHGPTGGAASYRIIQDVDKLPVALEAVRDVRGICVPGLGTRAGHLAAAGAGIAKREGRRVKKAAEVKQGIHPDAVGPREQLPSSLLLLVALLLGSLLLLLLLVLLL